MIRIDVTLLVLLALLLSASGVVAQAPTPADGTIPYSGRLSNDAGQPVADGVYAFTFALYDAAQDGNLLWSETQTGVTVKGGAFTALLGSVTPLRKEAWTGKGWLAVSVRGPGETGFTALAPRQELSAVAPASLASPSAAPSCAHDHLYENWSGSSTAAGLIVDNNNTTSGDGIRGYTSAPGVNWAGLFGVNDNGAAGGPGTYGYSTKQAGVYGVLSETWRPGRT